MYIDFRKAAKRVERDIFDKCLGRIESLNIRVERSMVTETGWSGNARYRNDHLNSALWLVAFGLLQRLNSRLSNSSAILMA